MATVIGGGLGGLSAAYYITLRNSKSKLRVSVVESTGCFGGWIKSVNTPDYTFEEGPRTIRPKGDAGLNTLNLISNLGLYDYVVPLSITHPSARNRMICVNNTLYSLPSSLSNLFFKIPPFSKPLLYAFYHDLMQPSKKLSDDTIYGFVERRFGKEIADFAISPMICGICAGDAKEISVKFLMKSLFDMEQKYGGVTKALLRSIFMKKTEELPPTSSHPDNISPLAKRSINEKWSVYTLKGGLKILPEKLKNVLESQKVNFYQNSEVEKIHFGKSRVYVKCKDIEYQLGAKHLFSCIPAHKLAPLLLPQHPDLSRELSTIPYVTVGLVNLFYESKTEIINPGFGFLVPPSEGSPILGVIYDSCCLPDQNGTVLTVMLGGRWFHERCGENPSEEHLFLLAQKNIASILKIKSTPKAYNVKILHNCIPQYIVGHYERIERIRKYINVNKLPISLIGSSFDGVGINDVILSAKNQVEKCNILSS